MYTVLSTSVYLVLGVGISSRVSLHRIAFGADILLYIVLGGAFAHRCRSEVALST